MVDGHQGWPEQLCRSGPAALDRLACFYYYYYYSTAHIRVYKIMYCTLHSL